MGFTLYSTCVCLQVGLFISVCLLPHYLTALDSTAYTVKASSGLSSDNRQALLNVHNEYRAKVARGEIENQPKAADMVALTWDNRMESGSQAWINRCDEQHEHDPNRKTEPYFYVGQNLAWDTNGKMFLKSAFDGWFDEQKGYNFDSKSCSIMACTHYTQLIWAKTRYVGCGYKNCGGTNNLGCNYATAGNRGKDHAYIKGEPCTKCPQDYPFCMSGGLCATKKQCDSSSSNCKCLVNQDKCSVHGSFDSANCKCTCKTGWRGVNCEDECKNKETWCDQQKANCRWDSNLVVWILTNCPRTCGWCGGITDTLHKDSYNIRVNAGNGNVDSDANKKESSNPDQTNVNGDEGANKGISSDNDQSGTDANVENNCSDIQPDSDCTSWKDKGHCTGSQTAAYMTNNCCKTCRASTGNEGEKTGETNSASNNRDEDKESGNGSEGYSCSNIQSDRQCVTWEDGGYCTNSGTANYMKKNCCKTCRSHTGSGGTLSDEPGKDDNSKGEAEVTKCVNRQSVESCEAWKAEGRCTGNDRYYMKENCCETCKDASEESTDNAGEEQCINVQSGSSCDTWRSRGYCTEEVYKKYMQSNCCKACESERKNEKSKSKKCIDIQVSEVCENWKAKDYCSQRFVEYMKQMCCKTCGYE